MLVVCILRERRQNQEKKIKIYALNLPSKASKFRPYLSFKVILAKSVLRSDSYMQKKSYRRLKFTENTKVNLTDN